MKATILMAKAASASLANPKRPKTASQLFFYLISYLNAQFLIHYESTELPPQWLYGTGYVDFTGMTGFFSPYANQLTVVLIQGLSVCDNCTGISNGLQGRTWFVTIFMHVFLCLDSWRYVKIVKRLVLHQQVLPFNSRCAFP